MSASRTSGARRIGGDELLVVAADDQRALAAHAGDMAQQAANETHRNLRDWSAEMTAAHRDGTLALAIVGRSLADMSGKLRHASERLKDPNCARINDRSGIFFTTRPLHPAGGRIALLFPGEGSQYPGMLADLCLRFDAARQAFDRADRAFEKHPRGLLPSQIAFGETSGERLWDMDCAVELVFTGNAAVHAVLSTFGLKPHAVLGHSTGDYSALFASGAIRAADDAEIVELMLGLNAIYQNLAATTTLPERALLTVGAGDATLVQRVLDLVPGLEISMDNCPHQRVLCGAPDALAQAKTRLATEGAIVEELAFRRGYHTDAFRPALPLLRPFFEALPLQSPTLELWSCASASRVPQDLGELRELALEQWAMPVRFAETVQRLWDEGVRIFVEAGPRSNLTGFVKDILRDRPHLAVACDGLHRPTVTQLLFAVGQLAAHRVPLDLSALGRPQIAPPSRRAADGESGHRRGGPALTLATGWPEVRLAPATAAKFSAPPPSAAAPREVVPDAIQPTRSREVQTGRTESRSPERQPAAGAPQDPRAAVMAMHLANARRMVQTHERVLMQFMTGGASRAQRPPARLLSGAQVRPDGNSVIAAVDLSVERYPFLADHTLGGRVSGVDPTLTGLPVMPFTMTLELAAEAALLVAPGQVCIGFENVLARRWIAPEVGRQTALNVVASRRSTSDGAVVVAVDIAPAGASGGGEPYFSAAVRLASSYPPAPAAQRISTAPGSRWNRDQVYRNAMFHGPLFRGIERVTHLDERGAHATLEVLGRHGLLSEGEAAFVTDPVLLDQPGQVVGVWTADRLANAFVIFPTRLARLDLFSPPLAPGSRVGCHAAIHLAGETGVLSDLEIDDGAGRVHARFTAWEDKRFDVPAMFLGFMLDPRRSSLCRPWTPAGASGADSAATAGARVARPDLPSGFAARGGIWQQVLAGLILSARERHAWQQSIGASSEAEGWLLARLAAKDVARRWLADRGLAIPPADIVIADGPNGNLQATGEWVPAVGGGLDIVVSSVEGDTVALVYTRAGQALRGSPALAGAAVPTS